MKRGIIFSLLVGAFLALAAAACGDDDGGSQSGSAGGAGQPVGTATSTGNQGGGQSANAVEELRARLAAQQQQTVRIRYAMRGTVQGQDVRASVEVAQKPPKLYVAFTFEGSGIPSDLGGLFGGFVVINDGTTSYLCFKADSEGMCLKGEGDTAQLDVNEFMNLFSADELALQDPDVQLEKVDGRRVAGIDSDCWRATSLQFDGLFCIGKEKPLLTYLEGTVEGESAVIELDEYSSNVPDSLFEPPYPVSDFSGIFATPTPSRGN